MHHDDITILIIESGDEIQNLFEQYDFNDTYRIIWAANQAEVKIHLLEDAFLGAILIAGKYCDSDFSIITEIKKMNPYVRIIIMAEKWELPVVRKAMCAGIFDFLLMDDNSQDISASLERAIQQSFSRISAAQARQKLLSLQRDLEIAGEVQNYILPETAADFGNCKIYARMIPTRNIGGDFYDYFNINEYKIGLVIGDVSGKGIPAALFMAITRSLIKMTALSSESPDECLKKVNTALSKENPSFMFATVFYAVFDRRSYELSYCNAGHNLPYLIKKDASLVLLEATGNMALGFDQNADYHTRVITLDAGSSLFLYTDGVTEATNAGDEMYGKERLENIISRAQKVKTDSPDEMLMTDLNRFTSGNAQSDDITILVLSISEYIQAEIDQSAADFSFSLQNNIEELMVLQENINRFCQANGLPFRIQHALEIALEELFSNIVNYAYHKNGSHKIEYTLSLVESAVQVIIRDDGQPFDPTQIRHQEMSSLSLDDRKVGGWGLQIVRKYIDDMNYKRINNQNILTLQKNISDS